MDMKTWVMSGVLHLSAVCTKPITQVYRLYNTQCFLHFDGHLKNGIADGQRPWNFFLLSLVFNNVCIPGYDLFSSNLGAKFQQFRLDEMGGIERMHERLALGEY